MAQASGCLMLFSLPFAVIGIFLAFSAARSGGADQIILRATMSLLFGGVGFGLFISSFTSKKAAAKMRALMDQNPAKPWIRMRSSTRATTTDVTDVRRIGIPKGRFCGRANIYRRIVLIGVPSLTSEECRRFFLRVVSSGRQARHAARIRFDHTTWPRTSRRSRNLSVPRRLFETWGTLAGRVSTHSAWCPAWDYMVRSLRVRERQ